MNKDISYDVATVAQLEAALQKIGLREKQATVYLACLGLGPSSVQNISRKAQVARATTYIILDALISRGLVVRYMLGKRPLFAAQPPDELLSLMKSEEKILEDRKETVNDILPVLRALSHDTNRHMVLRYHEGAQGLKVIRQELVRRCTSHEVWRNIAPADGLLKVFGIKAIPCKERIAKRIKSKTLLFTRDEKLKRHLLTRSASDLMERRFIDPSELDSITGITICGNYVALGLYHERVGGLLIDSAPIASMLSQFFDLTWKSAKKEV